MNQILEGDCLSVLSGVPDGSIRMCLTSPPYAMQRKNEYGGIPEADYPAWMRSWMAAVAPKLTPDGSVFVIIRTHVKNGCISDYVLKSRLLLREDGWMEPEELIWHKPDAPPLGSIERPRRTWENILWFSKSRKPFIDLRACGNRNSNKAAGFSGSNRFVFGEGPIHGGQNTKTIAGVSRSTDVVRANVGEIESGVQHPAMYPITLADQLILTFSAVNNIVLDVFCGSGTTCRAAKRQERKWIGIERNPEYVTMARALMNAPPAARRPESKTGIPDMFEEFLKESIQPSGLM